jgi:hypothetical protein
MTDLYGQQPQPTTAQAAEPLKLTLAQWHNHKQTVTGLDGVKYDGWIKKLAHKGPLTQFGYGTHTRSEWIRSDLQRCIIAAPHTGVIVVDVDVEAEFTARTRLARIVGRQDAISTRSSDRFHILVDGRGIPAGQWPRQGPIFGGDIKSNGWVPLPGSEHYSGELYEPVFLPDGTVRVVEATPELIAAMVADRADCDAELNLTGRPGLNGSGHGSAGGGPAGLDLPPTEQLLASGLAPGRRSHDMYRLAIRLWRQHEPVPPAGAPLPQAVEQTCWQVWQATSQSPPFGWGQALGCIESARGFVAANPTATTSPDGMEWAQGTTSTGAAMTMPVTCAQAEAVYAKWLYDSDPVPTRIVLATYAANMYLSGDPVWVMLVGGSGIGKTVRIMPLASLLGVVMASTITGEAALLSASPKRERAANATGGLLRMIGEHGLLVVKDFTSVLSMSRDRRSEVVAAMREVHDGRWDRHYGTDGGQVLTWEGHCGFIAGCTTAIDSAHAVLDAMGTRFLFVRLPDSDGEQVGKTALAHAGNEEQMRAELAAVTTALLSNLPGRAHEIHDRVTEWLVPLALMASRGRSPVEHDYHGEISLVLDAEAPTRIIKQLGQLWRACGLLGLGEAESWAAVRRAGLDSIPKLRRLVLDFLGSAGSWQQGPDGMPVFIPAWQPTTEVARAVGHPSTTTLRSLQDLAAHGLVSRQDTFLGGNAKRYEWALSPQARTWWEKIGRQ